MWRCACVRCQVFQEYAEERKAKGLVEELVAREPQPEDLLTGDQALLVDGVALMQMSRSQRRKVKLAQKNARKGKEEASDDPVQRAIREEQVGGIFNLARSTLDFFVELVRSTMRHTRQEREEEELKGPGGKHKHIEVAKALTVGMVGHPNAGKSSLINALMGRRACNVSSTPGHTKHLQTLQLPSLPEVELCDCPGLVFPAMDMPRPLQTLCGLYPLPNLAEPYTAVQYLVERVPLEMVYGLAPVKRVGEEELEAVRLVDDFKWTTWEICQAVAAKFKYFAQGGRYDTAQAAQRVLEDCLAGTFV